MSDSINVEFTQIDSGMMQSWPVKPPQGAFAADVTAANRTLQGREISHLVVYDGVLYAVTTDAIAEIARYYLNGGRCPHRGTFHPTHFTAYTDDNQIVSLWNYEMGSLTQCEYPSLSMKESLEDGTFRVVERFGTPAARGTDGISWQKVALVLGVIAAVVLVGRAALTYVAPVLENMPVAGN